MDRVADPPEMLKKWLLTIKLKAASLSIDLIFSLRVGWVWARGGMGECFLSPAISTLPRFYP